MTLRKVALSLVLQGATVLSKTLLLFLLARFLSPGELGAFGLVAITVSLAVHATGMDFYAYAMREILAAPRERVPRLARDQLAFHGVSYVVLLPILGGLLAAGLLPPELWTAVLGLVLLEHLAQEMHRFLVTLGRPVEGALLFFLRGGAWVYVLGILMAIRPALRSVETACIAWGGGSLLSLLVGAFFLRDLPWGVLRGAELDWRWIRNGVVVGLPLLAASSSLRLVLSLDRYVLQHFSGTVAVGIYTFYSSIRGAIQGFLDMGVLYIWRPPIVAAFRRGDQQEYRALMRRLSGRLIVLCVALLVSAGLAIRPLLAVVDRPIYGEHLGTYAIVLAQALLLALAEIPHTALFARSRDRAIVGSTFVGLGFAVLLNLLLVPNLGLEGAALATLGGAATILWMKARSLRRER